MGINLDSFNFLFQKAELNAEVFVPIKASLPIIAGYYEQT